MSVLHRLRHRMMVPEAGAALAFALAAMGVLAGCGGGSSMPAASAGATVTSPAPAAGGSVRLRPAQAKPVCAERARRALAGFLKVGESRVSMRPGVAGSGDRTCTLGVRGAARAVVDINTDPQVYFVLERTIVENAQLKSFQPAHPSPIQITHLGLDAAWFPDADYLLTTDGVRLVKVSVTWPHATERDRIEVGRLLAPRFLGRLHPRAADPNGS